MTSRNLIYASMVWLMFCLIAACSGGGSDASNPTRTASDEHPAGYLMQHAAEASTTISSCQNCHGTLYSGIGDAVSCLECHVNAPTFDVHISAYSDPNAHGAEARAAQIECRGCHGLSPNVFDGGIISDPNLFNNQAANCATASCHPGAAAHPTNWQGSFDDIDPGYNSRHYPVSTATVNESCALCHNVTGPGPGPKNGAPSCYANEHENSNSITTGCHSGGPF